MMNQNNNQLELIFPNKDISFKMFLFEGKDGHYYRDKHWHREVEIFAVVDGELDFFLDVTRIHLTSGQFVLVNSNEIHSINAPKPNRTIVLQIPVGTFRRYYLDNSFIYFSHSRKDTDTQLMELIRDMYDTYQEKALGYDLAVQGQFYHLLYLMVQKYRETELDREMMQQYRNRNKLSEIVDYIKDNYSEEITLERLGSTFGYSSTYISKMFQKYAGCGFKKYLENVRLEHAVKELDQTKDSLDIIAARNGFPDRKALSKAFQNLYNMTPRQYRYNKNPDEKVIIL